jgi:hypothetical protein
MLAGEVAIAAVVPNDDEVAGVDAASRKFRCLEQQCGLVADPQSG